MVYHLNFLVFRNLSILRLRLICRLSNITREPRYPILCQFLKPVYDDSPDFGRALAEFVGEACAYVKCLRTWWARVERNGRGGGRGYLAWFHTACEGTCYTFIFTFSSKVTNDLSLCIVECLERDMDMDYSSLRVGGVENLLWFLITCSNDFRGTCCSISVKSLPLIK